MNLLPDIKKILYCTGIGPNSAYIYRHAMALAEKVVQGGETARQNYLNFLKLGGSQFPLDALLAAGVDMRCPEPVQQAIEHFSRLVDLFIEEHPKL